MVDVSSMKIAAVVADLDPTWGKELLRHACREGRWARLLAPSLLWLRRHDLLDPEDQLPEGDHYTGSAPWDEFIPSQQFKAHTVRESRKGEHVNISEVRSWALAESAAASCAPPLWVASVMRSSLAEIDRVVDIS